MKLVNRAEFGWGATAAGTANPTHGLVIHYDGSNQGLARKPHTACVTYWKNTRRFHMGPARNWADIGYSFGCCPHGIVFEGRGLGRIQAAQPSGNTTWYSVTLMSGPDEDPTPEQIDGVRELRAWLMGKGVAGAVKGHRDFFQTSCPGDRLYRLVRNGTFSGPPTTKTTTKEDDVSAKDLWQHELPVPFGKPGNEEWQAGNILVNIAKWTRDIQAKLDAQNATIKTLVDALAAQDKSVNADALVAKIRSEIESITVRLDVPDTTSAS